MSLKKAWSSMEEYYLYFPRQHVDIYCEHVSKKDLQTKFDAVSTAEDEYLSNKNDAHKRLMESKTELVKFDGTKQQTLQQYDTLIAEEDADYAQKKVDLKTEHEERRQSLLLNKQDAEVSSDRKLKSIKNTIDHYENQFRINALNFSNATQEKEVLRNLMHPQSSDHELPYKTLPIEETRTDMELESLEKVLLLSRTRCGMKLRRAARMGLPGVPSLHKGNTTLREYQAHLLFLLKFEETMADANATVLAFDIQCGSGAGRRIKKAQAKRLQELEAEKEALIRQISKDQDGNASVGGGSVMTSLSNSIRPKEGRKRNFFPPISEIVIDEDDELRHQDKKVCM